ncbi:uncharacterized protein C8R40DRAFT_330672, partial [Lentinula edodes]|uniref:uncharacterized protein n=1 Tax=Lentinula edodes TaxID=5353 RepID=UPI001E8CF9FB
MESLATSFLHLNSNYMFQTSNYALYVWDHAITFSDEVDKIWSQPMTFASLLFYINRYLTHCQFIILQFEFHETSWTHSVCNRYVKFAGATTLCLVTVAELSMILRVYALYLRSKCILMLLLPVLVAQIFFSGWAVHFGERVPLPDGFPGCVLTGRSQWMAALWAAPLVTDSCIFFLTLWRTIRYRSKHGHISTMQLILRDGIIYFALICSVNIMNVMIYFLAVEDLKAVGASFSQILTAIMVARLQLNLKKTITLDEESTAVPSPQGRGLNFGRKVDSSAGNNMDFFSVGHLGDELYGSFFEGAFNGEDEEKLYGSGEIIELDERPLRVG